MRRRTWSIFALSLACVAVLAVVAALAAAPPNLNRALDAQRRLVTEHPQDPAAYNDLGNLLLLARQSAEAEKAYRRAVELDPQRVSALFNLGLLLQNRGETKQALGFFQQVLQIQPEHAWAHYQIGALYESEGQKGKAVAEYARAFSLDPQLAFPEVNPHVVDNKLVTEAMLRAYQGNYAVPQAPAVYEDGHRIADLLVPPPAEANGKDTKESKDTKDGKDAKGTKPAAGKPVLPAPPAGTAQPGATVLRQNDLDTRATGQAGPQGSVRGGRPATRTPTNVPRGMREWERPEPTVQQPGVEFQPPPRVPVPGQVVTPPPTGGIYYRPGIQSTGRLSRAVVPDSQG